MKTTYIHKQTTPSVEWAVNHNLNALPISDVSVLVDGKLVKIQPKSVEYVDPFNSIVRFSSAAAGEAMFAGAFARAFAVDLPESELPPVEPPAPTFETKRTTDLLMRFEQPTGSPILDTANNKTYPSPYIPPRARRTSELAKFGTASVYMPGVRGASLTANSAAALAAHTFPGNYTIEMFFYPTVQSQDAWLFSIGNGTNISWGSQGVAINSTNDVTFYMTSSTTSVNGSNFLPTSGVKVVTNQWNHVAVTRNGNVYSVYLNGVRGMTVTHSAAPATPAAPVHIGNANEYVQLLFPVESFSGYIDGYRVTKGVARYTAATYTVPTEAFGTTTATDPSWNSVSLLLNMETAGTATGANAIGAIADPFHGITYDLYANPGSVNLVTSATGGKFTGNFKPGGTYTDGNGWRSTGGYFNITEPYLAPGLKDFTWELWYKNVTPHASYQSLIDSRRQLNLDPTGLVIGHYNGELYLYSAAFMITNSAATKMTTGWNHVALVRKSGVFSIYLNGVAVGTYVGERDFTSDCVALASNFNGMARLNDPDAMLSEVRLSNVAQYTGNFTVPTAPLAVTTMQVPLVPGPAYSKFDKASIVGSAFVSDDGLTATTGSLGPRGVRSDVGVTSGKYYFELKIIPGSQNPIIGVGPSTSHSGGVHPTTAVTYTVDRVQSGGVDQAPGYVLKDNDVVGIRLDRDAGTVAFFANGTAIGAATLPTSGTEKIYAFVRDNNGSVAVAASFTANFGQEQFTYAVPTGFTAGLPAEKAWTPVWKAQSNSYNQATGYNWDGAAAVAAVAEATEAAIAIFDSTSGTFTPTNMFSFPMPAKWKTQHPFNYLMEDLPVVATDVATGTQTSGLLRYGSNTFGSLLTDAWGGVGYGRIGITNTTAPYFSAFNSNGQDYLSLSNQTHGAGGVVTNTRRFVILVR